MMQITYHYLPTRDVGMSEGIKSNSYRSIEIQNDSRPQSCIIKGRTYLKNSQFTHFVEQCLLFHPLKEGNVLFNDPTNHRIISGRPTTELHFVHPALDCQFQTTVIGQTF